MLTIVDAGSVCRPASHDWREFATALWLPGVLCVALFSGMSKRFRFGQLLAFCYPDLHLYYCTMDSGGYIDRDEYQFTSYKAPVHWFFKTNNGDLAVSDELTNDFFILHSLKYSIAYGASGSDYNAIAQKHKIMPTEDAQVLVQLSEGTLDTKYYILNQKLTGMSLQNWVIIKSWRYSNEEINNNDQINKIYDVPLLSDTSFLLSLSGSSDDLGIFSAVYLSPGLDFPPRVV